MNMTNFIKAIVPEGYVMVARLFGNAWVNRGFTSAEKATDTLTKWDAQGDNVYFAMASYKRDQYLEGERVRRRTKKNIKNVRSQWLDIDCGEGKPYGNAKEGLKAFVEFVHETKIPDPTYIVKSGRGLHIYWVFNRDLELPEWEAQAKKLATLCKGRLDVDTKPTTNPAAVLRPIGTHNWKDPDNPKEVKLIWERETIDYDQWVDALTPQNVFADAPPLTLDLPPHTGDFPPSDANLIAKKCPTIRAMRDTLGAEQTEPEWYASLCVLVHTKQGADICHQWSSGYEGYTEEECQAKIEHALETKPTRCETMRSHSEYCQGCIQKCNSPISLGFVHEQKSPKDEQLPPLPVELAKTFKWIEGEGLYQYGAVNPKQPEVKDWLLVSKFYIVVDFIWRDEETGEHKVQVRLRSRPHEWRKADLSLALLNKGGGAFLGELGGKLGIATTGTQRGLEKFVKTWIEHLVGSSDLSLMHRHMGWQEDGSFLLGENRYDPKGTVAPAILAKAVRQYASAHTVRGDYQRAAEIIQYLYGREHYEAYQFGLLASLGSVLVPLVHSGPIGLPLSLVSLETGRGKTTLARVGISMWGDPFATAQVVNAQGGVTEHALQVMAGQRRNLPILVDEVSEWQVPQLAKFSYAFSNGLAKVQGKAEGGLRDNAHLNWASVCYLTSNRPILPQLENEGRNSAAKIARIFEVTIPSHINLRSEDAVLLDELWKNYGGIGDQFLRYVVPNRLKVTEQLNKLKALINSQLGPNASSARFWVTNATCALIAGHVMKKLGLLDFDLKSLTKWTIKRIIAMMELASESYQEPEEAMNRLMFDLQKGLIITKNKGSRYHTASPPPGTSYLVLPKNGDITGRVILETESAYFPVHVVKDWCQKNNIDYGQLRSEASKRGMLLDAAARYDCSIGTWLRSGRHRCWKVDIKRLSPADNVVSLTAQQTQEEASG